MAGERGPTHPAPGPERGFGSACGSGFSALSRKHFLDNPDSIHWGAVKCVFSLPG